MKRASILCPTFYSANSIRFHVQRMSYSEISTVDTNIDIFHLFYFYAFQETVFNSFDLVKGNMH
jgi:hypothetical protein